VKAHKPHPYYRDHLQFLREAGERMAELFPRDADMLAHGGQDPDVERVLEGLAFLAGKVSERQVRNLSDICQFLFDVLFPHYLSPVPATSVVAFSSKKWAETVPRGTPVRSVPVSGTSCRFRTCYDADVSPLAVTSATWRQTGRGGELTLAFSGASSLDNSALLGADRLRLHLHGDPKVNNTLYHWLITRLERVEALGDDLEALFPLTGLQIRPLGLSEDEALLDYPPGSFSGFRLMQEYFTLPNKFLFLDIQGIWSALSARVPAADTFGLRFSFKLAVPRRLMVSRSQFQLGCTPVVNLFDHTADPMNRPPGLPELRVRPAGKHHNFEVVRIQEVTGITPGHKRTRFPVLSELDLDAGGGCCQVQRRADKDGALSTYIHLTDPPGELPPHEQLISVDLLCSNGLLTTGLQVGDITHMPEHFSHLTCRNITRVTPPGPVPMGETLRQRLVSHLALTQLDLTDIDALRRIIELYHPFALVNEQAQRARDLLLEGLLKVESREVITRHGGVPVRGQATLVTASESMFGSQGDLFLFGTVLNELVALQAPINWFSQLGVRWTKTKSTFRWPRRLGTKRLSA